jgi:hypothetical protein
LFRTAMLRNRFPEQCALKHPTVACPCTGRHLLKEMRTSRSSLSSGTLTIVRHERKGPRRANVCDCLIDEGRAPRNRLAGAGSKPPSAAVVKSHGRERRRKRHWKEPGQVTGKKRTARKPLMTCRKRRDDVETTGNRHRGTSFGGACLRTEAASGIKVA